MLTNYILFPGLHFSKGKDIEELCSIVSDWKACEAFCWRCTAKITSTETKKPARYDQLWVLKGQKCRSSLEDGLQRSIL